MELILNSKSFSIPLTFQAFSDIDCSIYQTLIATKKYKVRSNVNEKIFQSFIQYWIYNEIPDFNQDNIIYYSELSEEFDFMKDIVELYIQNAQKSDLLLLKRKYNQLKKEKEKKIKMQRKKLNHYQRIIYYLFNNSRIDDSFKFNKSRKKIFRACKKEQVKLVNLLTQFQIESNGFKFVLNFTNKTAELISNINQKSDIIIPRSIQYNSEEFIITVISEYAFANSNIQSIQFSEDSELNTIEQSAFYLSSIKSFSFPKHVKVIGKIAFAFCSKLKSIEFSKDSELSLIEKYAFLKSGIESIKIPPHVKKICENAFSECDYLEKVEFSNDSELNTFDKKVFFNIKIESITIPSKVTELNEGWCDRLYCLKYINISPNNKNFVFYNNDFLCGKSDQKSDNFDLLHFARRNIEKAKIPSFIKHIHSYAFQDCEKLQSIEFSDNSELESIDSFALLNSSVETIIIPSKVINLNENWCSQTKHLINIKIMPNNNYFKYFDDTFIVRKSIQNFDSIVFCRRNTKKVTIPDFIKRIEPYAFQNCVNLQSIEFGRRSKLTSIGECSFSDSSIVSISIPPNVNEIGSGSFIRCNQLKNVDFSQNKKMKTLNKYAFAESSVEKIYIPDTLIKIDESCFSNCIFLKSIIFSENSELKTIGDGVFYCSSLRCLSIPSKVTEIGDFMDCDDLQIIEIGENSELKSIDTNNFNGFDEILIMIPLSSLNIII